MDLITLHVTLIYMLLPFITITNSAPIRYINHYNTKMASIGTNNEETININYDEKVVQESDDTTNGKLRGQPKTLQKTNVQEMMRSTVRTTIGQLNEINDDAQNADYWLSLSKVLVTEAKVAIPRAKDQLSEYLKTVGTVMPSNDEESSKTYLLMFDERGKLQKNNIKNSMKKPKKSSKVTHAVYQKDQK